MLSGFPPSAQRAIKLDEGEELVELGFDECVLGGEELLLFLKDFEVTGAAREVAVGGNFHCGMVGLDGAGLLDPRLGVFFASDKRVGEFSECVEDSALVA